MEQVVIKVRKDGPYKVTGPVTIIDADGNEFDIPEGDGIVLCRCGALEDEAVLRQDPLADRLRGGRAGGRRRRWWGFVAENDTIPHHLGLGHRDGRGAARKCK